MSHSTQGLKFVWLLRRIQGLMIGVKKIVSGTHKTAQKTNANVYKVVTPLAALRKMMELTPTASTTA